MINLAGGSPPPNLRKVSGVISVASLIGLCDLIFKAKFDFDVYDSFKASIRYGNDILIIVNSWLWNKQYFNHSELVAMEK
jgi:hypothetical protein